MVGGYASCFPITLAALIFHPIFPLLPINECHLRMMQVILHANLLLLLLLSYNTLIFHYFWLSMQHLMYTVSYMKRCLGANSTGLTKFCSWSLFLSNSSHNYPPTNAHILFFFQLTFVPNFKKVREGGCKQKRFFDYLRLVFGIPYRPYVDDHHYIWIQKILRETGPIAPHTTSFSSPWIIVSASSVDSACEI